MKIKNQIIFNLGKAKQLLRYWQKELRLQDWDIFLSIVPKKDLLLPNCKGTNIRQLGLKCASIQLLDPKDFDSNIEVYDMEQTLVHELLHLTFAIADNQSDCEQGTPWYIEQGIELVSKALINQKRSDK